MALTQISTAGVKDDAVTAGKIPANAVGSSELADNAVDTAAITNDAVTEPKIADNAVTRAQIIDGAINGAKCENQSIGAEKITDGTIATAKIANNAVTTAKIADDAVTQAKLNFPVANRNLIINGAMQVAQRGTSSTANNGYYTIDRIKQYYQDTDEAPTFSQADVASGTTPYTLGFRKSLKVTNGNQTSGAGVSDQIQIISWLEAQDIANSGWNYKSSSSFLTFSFWIKSSVAQAFNFYVQTNDGTEKNMPFSTPSLSADTWTKVEVQIKGDSGIDFNNDNGMGLGLYLAPYLGTNYTDNSITNGEWITFASGTRYKDVATTWYTTNDATVEYTGLQLEVGSVATDFEHRSYAQELFLCLRYYQIVRAASITAASTTAARFNCPLLCKTRHSAPSVGKFGSGNIGIGDMVSYGSTSSATPSSDGYAADDLMMSCQVTAFSGLTQYRQYCHEVSGSQTGLIAVDAEL